jgi:hypothetical protein
MLSVYQGRYLSRNPLRTTKAPKELVQESWEFKWRSKSPSWAGDRTSFGLPTQVLNDKGRLLQCSRIVSQKFGRSVSLSRYFQFWFESFDSCGVRCSLRSAFSRARRSSVRMGRDGLQKGRDVSFD